MRKVSMLSSLYPVCLVTDIPFPGLTRNVFVLFVGLLLLPWLLFNTQEFSFFVENVE